MMIEHSSAPRCLTSPSWNFRRARVYRQTLSSSNNPELASPGFARHTEIGTPCDFPQSTRRRGPRTTWAAKLTIPLWHPPYHRLCLPLPRLPGTCMAARIARIATHSTALPMSLVSDSMPRRPNGVLSKPSQSPTTRLPKILPPQPRLRPIHSSTTNDPTNHAKRTRRLSPLEICPIPYLQTLEHNNQSPLPHNQDFRFHFNKCVLVSIVCLFVCLQVIKICPWNRKKNAWTRR